MNETLMEIAVKNEMKEKKESILGILKRKHTENEFKKALALTKEYDELDRQIKQAPLNTLRALRP